MDKATLFRTVAFVSFVFDNCSDYHKRAESHFFFDFPLVYGNFFVSLQKI